MTAPAPSLSARPAPAPLAMPTQDLDQAPAAPQIRQPARVHAARLTAFGGAALLSLYGFGEMMWVFGNDQITYLQALLLALFTLTFGWIALSTTQTLAALFLPRNRTPDEAPLRGRTAIIMPVYNEDPAATCAALQAMGEGIDARDAGQYFEIFILSDTTDPTIWVRETACVARLAAALEGRLNVWYRHRATNTGRKAGNLRDFVERWGGRYDHMLVLDADSMMAPDTILRMTRRMEAAPRLGILQTVPMLYGGKTLFARVQQFAGRVYGPVIARGVSAWQGTDGNYWGHNAMIRVPAFAACCGLPDLPGRMPFGGHVMSHDFVEAALIRRGGWEVRMDTDLGGSWEGAPETILDVAARDRRWAQGNFQHAKIIGAAGLKGANRAHFLIGIGSYLMSPIWLALLLTGGVLTAQSLLLERDYFGDGPQLFPNWPVFDAERMMWLLLLSAVLLFLPKITGLVRSILVGELRRAHGGALRLMGGGLLEILLSALFAPLLMLLQAHQVFDILSGRDSGWSAQSRNARAMTWGQAFKRHWTHVAVGMGAGTTVILFAPSQIVWLAPVLIGLVFAPVLSRQSGRVPRLAVFNLLRIPEEAAPPAVYCRSATLQAQYDVASQRTIADLLADPAARAEHIASAPDRPEKLTKDLELITAKAKIAATNDPAEALSWLGRDETTALLGSVELLEFAGARFSAADAQPKPQDASSPAAAARQRETANHRPWRFGRISPVTSQRGKNKERAT